MFIGLSLIALAMGYKVFADASKEKKERHMSLGRAIGLYIMLLAFASSFYSVIKYCAYFSTNNHPIMARMTKLK